MQEQNRIYILEMEEHTKQKIEKSTEGMRKDQKDLERLIEENKKLLMNVGELKRKVLQKES